MRANLERTGGLIHSERVLLALVGEGLTREEAYALVQRNAMRSWETGEPLPQLLEADAEVVALLDRDKIAACFDLGHALRNLDVIFARLEKLEP